MTTECGKVIAANRKRLGWTQAELGAKLNVTAQAVSKWENGNAEPDFATLQRLTELFGIGLEELFGGKSAASEAHPAPTETEHPAPVPTAQPAASQAAAPAKADPRPRVIIGYCDACKKPIEQNSAYHVYPATRGGAQRIVCKACFDRDEARRKRTAYEEERKNFRRSMIVATLVAVAVVLVGVIAAIAAKNPIYLVSIAVAVALFFFVAQCFWTSYALDLLLFFCRSFRLPGLIFTLDLDGILWFIFVKLLFGLLTGMLSVLLFAVGLCISMVVGVVTFPFCLPTEIKKLKEMERSIS